ncbi:MAG: DUF134 domain-containing protein [Methanospirillaceae archaeon]|nr:DUF134 domain-containing protein [Methanospirillaceae archaeon]
MEQNNGAEPFRRRGRPRIRRQMGECGPWRCYAPQCNTWEDNGSVYLYPEEIELLRLIDLVGMDQEEAATVLGVSRKTVWKDLHEARLKVTDALVNGKMIKIHNCIIQTEGSCPRDNNRLYAESETVNKEKGE